MITTVNPRSGRIIARSSIAALVLALAGCSSGGVFDNPEKELETSVLSLHEAFAAGDAETAWGLYSVRCKSFVNHSLVEFSQLMDKSFVGRSPDIESVTVSVNGTAGQAIVVDNDPNATSDSLRPKTWSRETGEWLFDNCF